jgi:hypothetical protein
MKITAPYRGRRASKRLDLTDMREVLRDRRVWTAIGRVVVPAGETSHVAISDDDVLVDVVLQPTLQDITCRLAAGVWVVPAVGEEVIVVLPEGEMAFMPTIVAILSSGSAPTTQGPAQGRIAIVRPEVVVHDGAGGAAALAMLSSLQATVAKLNALIDKYKNHTHTGVTTGTGTSGLPSDATITHADSAVGTTVLKAK